MMNEFHIENGILIKYNGSSDRVIIPHGVRAIGDQAFADCTSLTQIEIPDTVTEIGNYAFYRCSALGGITIPGRVYRIGDGAFFGCSSFTEIVIPDSVTVIGDRLLAGCHSIRRYTLPAALSDAVITVGSLIIKNGVVRRRFGEADTVVLPENVTAIGDNAFYGSKLRRIVLHSGVTSIGEDAFGLCRYLSDITVPDSVTHIGCDAFWGLPPTGRLSVKPSFMSVIDDKGDTDTWSAAIRGFLARYSCGKTDEAEIAEWRKYLSRRTLKAFKLLPDEATLYKFFTDTNTLSPKRAEALITQTENVECRAILLEYVNKRKKRKNSSEEIIDRLFSLDE